jgi:hypothetical protein
VLIGANGAIFVSIAAMLSTYGKPAAHALRVPFGSVLAAIGILIAGALLTQLSRSEWLLMLGTFAVGVVHWYWMKVDGPASKTRRTRQVPLNSEALSVLARWREQSSGTDRVFEIATGLETAWSHVLKSAQIIGFRWHDLRHHFASRLVQRFSEGCPSTQCAIS